MKNLSGFVYKAYQNNKRQLWECLIFSVCIGLLAHGYTFFRNTFSHDSLQEFNGDIFGTQWKISLGRWFVPIYQLLSRGNITLPLLVGLSSLLWIGLASFMTVLWSGYLMNYHIQQRYDIYFEYVLHYPISTVTEQQAELFNKSSKVNEMPVFPKDGCISVIDNTLVVKLGACDL